MTDQNSTPTAPLAGGHSNEPHADTSGKLNWLRAGVLGANDGIVSVACILLGVIAAGQPSKQVLLVGLAAWLSGAVAMALGEYVSVSTQRDSEKHLIAKETRELREAPEEEHQELVGILAGYGIERSTADLAAKQIAERDPLAAHLRLELGLDQEELTNPWAAAFSSAVAFSAGSLLPILCAVLTPDHIRAWAVVGVSLLTLSLAGAVSARLGETSVARASIRLLIGGCIGLAVTYAAGAMFGA